MHHGLTATPPARSRRVLIAGATGLVGSHLLAALLDDPTVDQVHVLSRRTLSVSHPALRLHMTDFVHLPDVPAIDEVYLALGTTIKQAGSQAAFRAVDLQANLSVARAGVAAGARRVGLVSAVGADARSPVFYNRVKGELEQALETLDLLALVIARPSLLVGNRSRLGQPFRFAERVAEPLMRLVSPVLPPHLRPVRAIHVARALTIVTPQAHGKQLLDSSTLTRLGSTGANAELLRA